LVPVGNRPVSVVGMTGQRVGRSEQAINLRDLFSLDFSNVSRSGQRTWP
jgi:hypothetical protein